MKGFSKDADCNDCTHNCILKISQSNKTPDYLNIVRKEITYSKGETIIKQGTFISHSIYIKKGLVKIVIEAENSKEIILKLAVSKEHIGLPFLFMDDIYPYSIVAMKETTMCLIKKDVVLDLIEKNDKIRSGTLKRFSNNHLNLYYKITIIGTRNNHGKLAHTLLNLTDEKLAEENALNHLSRREIAEMAFISLESANKILNEMKNDLIIDISDSGIKILKPDLLMRLSKIG